MSDFEVRGAEQFLKLSKALKNAGRTELRKELTRGLQRGTKPLIPKAREAARTDLPHRGGLAAQVSKEPMRVQVRTGANPGVRVVVGNRKGGSRAANQGRLRHPVFARPGTSRDQWTWVTQRLRPGWFDRAMRRNARGVRPALEQAIEDVAKRVVREAR